MTDLEKLVNLLTEFGVGYEKKDSQIICMQSWDDSNKIEGYSGFYTVFNFDSAGKFLNMGAYE